MKMKSRLILTASMLVLVKATPSCTYSGKNLQDVICTAGLDDYKLERGLVSDNNRTKSAILRNCRIKDVDFESFEEMYSLTYIDISHNKIPRLRLGVLDGIRAVTYFNASYNSINEIPLGLFDQMPNLEVLDFRGNNLETIELGVLDNQPKLKYLDLSNNAIDGKNFEVHLFDISVNIKNLDFSRNDMSEASDTLLLACQSLEILKLDRCSLKEVPKFVTITQMQTLKRIVLSNNQIAELKSVTFTNLVNLEFLDLNSNEIVTIDEDAFKSLRNLKNLILRHNKISKLEETVFQSIAKLNTIDLSHNKIEYVPVNAFRGSVLRNLNLADNRFTYLQDNFCLELKNSGAKLMKFYFNENPWQCACLRDVINEMTALGIEYNSIKYNGMQPVCVNSNVNSQYQFICKRQASDNDFFMKLYDDLIVGSGLQNT